MSSPLQVGYVPLENLASLAFPIPRILRSYHRKALSDRAVQACPAVNVFEQKTIVVPSPFSLQIRCIPKRGGFDFHIIEKGTRIDRDLLNKFVSFMPREFWRHENVPVVQVSLPHVFICDEVCYLTQAPAWTLSNAIAVPGMLISGRFPTHIWPRALNLAFEWLHTEKDFVMRRGDPCCFLIVESDSPERPVRLVAGEMHDELRSYMDKIKNVVGFTSGTFSLFEQAEKIRPENLLRVAR